MLTENLIRKYFRPRWADYMIEENAKIIAQLRTSGKREKAS